MAQPSVEAQEWLTANGCSDRDLYYMFSSRAQAAAQVPPDVVAFWELLRARPPPALPAVADLVPTRRAPAWAAAALQAASPVKRRTRAAVRKWAGVPEARAQKESAWMTDLAKREACAAVAVELLAQWPVGPVAAASQELRPADFASWKDRWIKKTARAAMVQQYVSAWRHFARYCAAQGWSAFAVSGEQLDAYLHSPTPTGKTKASVARRRFHALAWCRKHWQAPVPTEGRLPPEVEHVGQIMDEQQAVAADPWILLQLEPVAVAPWTPASSAAAQAWVLWASALRFSHLGRSVFTALTNEAVYGVCALGKRSPGYRWAIPRRGPTGEDVGGRVFQRWLQLSEARGGPLPSLAFDLASGAPLTHNDMRSALPATFGAAGAQAPELVTTYSLRRGAATLCSIRGASELSEAANGFWLAKRSADMPARYHGRRVQKALEVKLHTFAAVSRALEAKQRLTWQVAGALLHSEDPGAIRAEVQRRLAVDSVVCEVPREWLSVTAVPREFGVHPEAPRAPSPPREPVLPEKREAAKRPAPGTPGRQAHIVPARSRPWPQRWQATGHQGHLVVHLLEPEAAMPVCRRRRGAERAKPLARVSLEGSSLAELASVRSSAVLCEGCARTIGRAASQFWDCVPTPASASSGHAGAAHP